jgi:hypothetical protein
VRMMGERGSAAVGGRFGPGEEDGLVIDTAMPKFCPGSKNRLSPLLWGSTKTY